MGQILLLAAAFLALFVAVGAHVRRQRRTNIMLRAGCYPRVEEAPGKPSRGAK